MDRIPRDSRFASDPVARSGLYRLLARFWLREVDADFLRQLQSISLCNEFVESGGVLPEDDGRLTSEQLAIDYCRLFIGPSDHLPPYQSVWQSGQFQEAASASMKRFVEIAGYQAGVLSEGMMLDHLGVQLDLMGQVLEQYAGWPVEMADREAVLELASAFFATHLVWPIELLETAARRAETDFYRSVIFLTRNFLESERHVLAALAVVAD